MGHLNDMHDKYATQGFTVLAVTNEDKAKVDSFVENHNATHPIVIESSDSSQAYGAKGFPSSFLIAPDGTIAWEGHPGSVPEDLLEELLTKATMFEDLPRKLQPIGKSIQKGKLSDAVKALERYGEGDLEPDEKEWAGKLKDWLEWNKTSVTKRAQKATEKGDFYGAWRAYEAATKDWKGSDMAKEAAEAIKALLADKDKKAEIEAGKKLAKITRKLGDSSPAKAIKALKPMTSKKYEGTTAGKQAEKLIKSYEEEIRRLKGG